jgi:hypothetical protein
MQENFTYILPHQLVELLRWDVARGTLLIAAGVDRSLLAATGVVGVSSPTGAAHARQTANTATHQCPEQILMRRIVAASELLIVSQFLLNEVKLLLTHDGWYLGHGDPLFTRSVRMTTMVSPDRSQRRVALA